MSRERIPDEVAALYLAPLDPAEFERRVGAALRELDGPELENLQALLGWFQRRYPTAGERLAYARRAYLRWVGAAGARRGE